MGVTANWQLPYPEPLDRPCDGADAVAALAAKISSVFDSWDADLAWLRNPPAAMVSWESETPQSLAPNAAASVRFDTTQLDTASMVDLGQRPDRIYFPRKGLYAVGASVVGQPSAVTTGKFSLKSNATEYATGGVQQTLVGYEFVDEDRLAAEADQRATAAGQVWVDPTVPEQPVPVWLEFDWLGSVTFTVTYAEMWAFWMSD